MYLTFTRKTTEKGKKRIDLFLNSFIFVLWLNERIVWEVRKWRGKWKKTERIWAVAVQSIGYRGDVACMEAGWSSDVWYSSRFPSKMCSNHHWVRFFRSGGAISEKKEQHGRNLLDGGRDSSKSKEPE